MKTLLKSVVVIVFIFCSAGIQFANAQITAGSVPDSSTLINPNINLSLHIKGKDTCATLNFCTRMDMTPVPDGRICIERGFLETDGQNLAYMRLFRIEIFNYAICTDTGKSYYPQVSYLNFGDTLCNGYHKWVTDSIYKLGSFGGFAPPYENHDTVTNKYIAYKLNSTGQLGWIKISYRLNKDTISLSINEVLLPCKISGIREINNKDKISIGPNPTNDGRIVIWTKEKISEVEIFNSMYQLIKSIKGQVYQICLPEHRGIYFLRVYNTKGDCWNKKVVRM